MLLHPRFVDEALSLPLLLQLLLLALSLPLLLQLLNLLLTTLVLLREALDLPERGPS